MNVLTSITVLGFLIFMRWVISLQQFYKVFMSMDFYRFGPSIIQKKYKDITYSFRAFPLGGFVSFPDEELNNIDPKDPNLLKNRPIMQRVIVISAGVFANLILAYTILIINVTTLVFHLILNQFLVLATQPDKAASLAGLKSGDKILKIESNTLGIGDQAVATLVREIQNSTENPMLITIERDGFLKI